MDSRRRSLIPFFFLALLLHGLFIAIQIYWQNHWADEISKAKPMEIQPIDSKQLTAIRKKWQQKQFLISPDQKDSQETAPSDAKFFSNQNRKVEKETQAQLQQSFPKPGAKGSSEADRSRDSQVKESLKKLGVNWDLTRRPSPAQRQEELLRKQFEESRSGADQFLADKSIDVGSENLLNSQKSVFYTFYLRFYEAVVPIWQSKARMTQPSKRLSSDIDYVTVVDVILDDQGNMKRLLFLKSSGVPEFDDAVEKTFASIRGIPHPPQGLIDNRKEVHIPFAFYISTGGAPLAPQVRVLPPGRMPNWN